MPRSERPGRTRLTSRLLSGYAVAYTGLILALGFVAEVAIRSSGLDREEAAAVRLSILVTTAVAGLAGVGVMVLVARRVARPVEELTELAGAVAEGRLDVAPRRSSVTEIDRLGLAIGHIATDLGRRIEETEGERRTLDVILSSLPQGVMLVDGRDVVEYVNPAWQELLGVPPRDLRSLLPRGVVRLVRTVRADQAPAVERFEVGAPSRVLRVTATPLPRGGRVLVLVADVTDRERVEAMRRDFVADASHELKTPVSAILASAETLEMALDGDPADARRFAGRIRDSSRQLADIVSDLLDLSRLEAGTPTMEAVRFDWVVREEAGRYRERAVAAGIDYAVETVPVIVIGSAPDLGLAVRNLCDNAIRYTDPGGVVRVRLVADGSSGVLTVTDTGAGIPTRDLPRIFERFYRVDVARSRETGGTGLGLSLVRHVAERHGGGVGVESRLGAGSTFRLHVPIAVSGGAPPATDAQAAEL
jgi:two-component system, OmpR family, phosphate regulon sensor histidine kinase PhoR